jgi:nucleoside-diphosphate-sugar epimerase
MRELADRYEVTGFDAKPSPDGLTQIEASLLDRAAVMQAAQGQDAVVHIAARANIWSGNGSDIIATNVTGTWNILEAAEAAGVKKVVLCSSDSVVGFTVMSSALVPPVYLPIDQAHPLHPSDPYAVSKQCIEVLGRSFASRGQLDIVALRPVFILYPEMYDEVRARASDPVSYAANDGPTANGPSAAGGGPVWHYVDPRDVARAFRLAVERPGRAFESFFLAARSTLAPEPTIERLARRIGRAPVVKKLRYYEGRPFAPLYDLEETRTGLDWTPEHDLRPLFFPPESDPAGQSPPL